MHASNLFHCVRSLSESLLLLSFLVLYFYIYNSYYYYFGGFYCIRTKKNDQGDATIALEMIISENYESLHAIRVQFNRMTALFISFFLFEMKKQKSG